MNARKVWSALILAGVVSTFAFANCGRLLPTAFSVDASTGLGVGETIGMTTAHPAMAEVQAPTEKGYLVPREYVVDLLGDIFASTAHPVQGLTAQLRAWVLNKPGAFGGNCDLYSSETGNDCAGDAANNNLAPLAPASTMRAVALTAVCENILADDNAVAAVLEKMSPPPTEPEEVSVGQLYGLFRRGWDADPDYVQSLLQLNDDLKTDGAVLKDRWRLLIQTMCEDPVWEAL